MFDTVFAPSTVTAGAELGVSGMRGREVAVAEEGASVAGVLPDRAASRRARSETELEAGEEELVVVAIATREAERRGR